MKGNSPFADPNPRACPLAECTTVQADRRQIRITTAHQNARALYGCALQASPHQRTAIHASGHAAQVEAVDDTVHVVGKRRR
eukprot:12096239-Alexandrium_andersonii.AAC.1